MMIFDKTRNSCIAAEAIFAVSFFARFKGLLGKKSLPAGHALVISPCISIHTIGMRFPIDAVFYDKDKRTVGVVKGIRPGRLSRLYPRAEGVIEAAEGSFAMVEPGDELIFAERHPWSGFREKEP